jgi:hypothetical protein
MASVFLVRLTSIRHSCVSFSRFFRYLKHSNRFGHATKRNMSICFLGPPSSGKTSLINYLFGPVTAVDMSSPTVGFRRYVVPFENPNVSAQVAVSE